jgi:hypothetical protein
LFGPIFIVIGTGHSYVHEAGESWWITYVIPVVPYLGALMVGTVIFSFLTTFRTTVRHTQEIEHLRQELEALKAGEF